MTNILELHICVCRLSVMINFISVYGKKDTSCKGRDVRYEINLLKSTGHVMHQQFNIQQLYVLPTLYLYVLYLSENKQRLGPFTA